MKNHEVYRSAKFRKVRVFEKCAVFYVKSLIYDDLYYNYVDTYMINNDVKNFKVLTASLPDEDHSYRHGKARSFRDH